MEIKISDNIKEVHQKHGLAQDFLTKTVDIPYTRLIKIKSTVITKPSIQTVGKISKGLEITIDEFLN